MTMTVEQLAATVKHQREHKRVFIARPDVGFRMADDAVRLELQAISEFPIGQYAHMDLAEFTGIDRPYYKKMLAEKPRLVATNVNAWLPELAEQPRLIRTLEGRTRCVRSNKFRALDNWDLMEA